MPALLLGLGTVSIVLLFLNNSIRERVVVRDVEVASQVAEVETRLSKLHLWVEEYVTGDRVQLDQIQEHESESRRILGEISSGSLLDEDARLARELLAAIEPEVERFIRLSTERIEGYDQGLEVGVGSSVDVAYDEVFYSLSADLRRLNDELAGRVAAAHEQSRTLFQVMSLAWAASKQAAFAEGL